MAEVVGGGLTAEQLLETYRSVQGNPNATADDMFSNVMSAKAIFISPDAMTVTNLLANYPATAGTLGKYARVSDLWGSVRTVMVCEGDASGYYWRPQRTDYAPAPVAATSGAMTLTPLVTAPIINLTGTLTGNVTVTPSSVNVWPGASFTVSSNSVLGLFGVNLTGLVGGGTVPLLSGGIRTVTYFSGTGWKAA